MNFRKYSPEKNDCLLLLLIVVLSALPYVYRLGFYSDDWSYQAVLAQHSGEGFRAMFRALLVSDPNMRVRPMQASYLVLGFQVFGHHAAPYHVFNTLMLGATVALFYLNLRELALGRWASFAISVCFGTLPHYSTDRVWIASHQAVFSMAFALLGIHALLRALRTQTKHIALWIALAGLSLILSILSYEVALGLIAASLAMIGARVYRRKNAEAKLPKKELAAVLITAGLLFCVGIIKTQLQTRFVAHGHFFNNFFHYLTPRTKLAVSQMFQFNFWTYGLHMPAVLLAMYRSTALNAAAVACASGVAVISGMRLWRYQAEHALLDRAAWGRVIGIGCVLFGLGYLLFCLNVDVDFTTAGMDNRITIASALGAAFGEVGMVGLACSLLKDGWRAKVSSVALSIVCGLNCLAVDGIAHYWAGAVPKQKIVMSGIQANVSGAPRGSVVLLDGFCRYFGPAVVFETDWDATGVLQLMLEDSSLKGDVVSPTMRLLESSIQSTSYGEPVGNYAYSDRLFVYNVKLQTLSALESKAATVAYFEAVNPTMNSGCAAAQQGRGEKVF